MIITSKERPNAWVGDFSSLEDHIKRFFRDTSGEIWVFGTSLFVLRNDEKFSQFYLRTIVELGRDKRVSNVKLFLDSDSYMDLQDPEKMAIVQRNLARYPTSAPKILVGKIEDIEGVAPEGVTGHPWVMCVENGDLNQNNAIAIRLLDRPFPLRQAITWPLVGGNGKKTKISTYFQEVFCCRDYFKRLAKGGEAARRRRSLLSRRPSSSTWCKSGYSRKRILVIIALDEEIEVSIDVLGLHELDHQDSSWYCEILGTDAKEKDIAYSVFVRGLPQMGNVDAAVTTLSSLNEFDADVVVLLGITGGIGIQPPSVVIATTVHAYEYASVVPKGRGSWEYLRESREVKSVFGNRSGILRAKRLWGQSPSHRIMKRISGEFLTRGKVDIFSQEKLASGSKKSKCQQFLGDIIGRDKKINAIEMEGEGVGYAATYFGKPFVVIKGVSDCADETTEDDGSESDDRSAAANAASHFLRMMLEKGCL